MTKSIASVAVAHVDRFTIEREGIAGPSRDDQIQGLVIIFTQFIVCDGLIDFRHAVGNDFAESGTSIESISKNLGMELEVVDLNPIHFGHIHVVTGWIERIGVVGLAQKTGGATLAHHVALLQWSRQHHKRKHRLQQRTQTDQLRAEIGEIFRTRRFELTRRAYFIGRVTGHHLIDGGRMIEKSLRGIAHRPNKCEFVVDLCEPRKVLRELHAGQLRRNRRKGTLHIVRHVFLWIPKVDVARSSLQITEDDALCLAPTRASADRI